MRCSAYDFGDRTAFVTGAAGGIGRATAVLLAEAGATAHCADRDAAGLAETARLTAATGGPTARTHTLDVTSRPRLKAAMESADSLDILVAAAGIMHVGSVLGTNERRGPRPCAGGQLQRSPVRLPGSRPPDALPPRRQPGTRRARGCRPPRRWASAARQHRHVASGAVDTARANLFAYSAAKAAVVQLAKTLATELGPHGIRVNAVAPGWIRTPMTARHDAALQQRTEASMTRISPLGRVGEPEDVAHTTLHPASDAAAFTTGQILRPHGDVAMPW